MTINDILLKKIELNLVEVIELVNYVESLESKLVNFECVQEAHRAALENIEKLEKDKLEVKLNDASKFNQFSELVDKHDMILANFRSMKNERDNYYKQVFDLKATVESQKAYNEALKQKVFNNNISDTSKKEA